MIKGVLDACLTWEQREAGFWISDDVDWLTLHWGSNQVAHFTTHATVKEIRDEANRLMTQAQYS